ncbi:hypothetical protein B0J14DRAFT_707142 [Halenospora varia]|nr:hypothetical protein B0J14DRAFT_707142 [Halenospora varia]
MQLTTIFSLLTIAATSANASVLQIRAQAKLNQYPKLNCKDNNGGNNPSFHSSPVRGACTKIDGSMVSAYVVPGSGAKAVFYMDDNCTQKLREQTAGEECVVLFQIAKGKNIAAVAMV